MSKVHARSHEITNKPLRVRTTKTLWQQTWKTKDNAEKCASDVKKMRIVVNRISKVRQTTCNWIKKILDEATRIVNVFLISWLFCLFLLCSISLLVKYDFILRYEAWVNAITASSFIENFLKSAQNQSLSSEICSGSSLEIIRSLPIIFFSQTGLENSREIGRFFREFVPKNPAKFDFFSTTYQKPCVW